MENTRLNTLKKTVLTAIFSAVALALYFIEFPLLPSTFLKMDFSDIIAVIGGVLLGPWYAVIIELIKNILEMLIKGLGSTLGFGNLSNFIVGVAYSVPFSIIARRVFKTLNLQSNKINLKRCVAASLAGAAAMLVIGFFTNCLVTPMYFKFFVGQELTRQYVLGFAATATAFNAIKALILSVLLCIILPICGETLKKTVD